MSDNKTVARAAQASADAALAALDRPWLIIEGFNLSERQWKMGSAPLKGQFKISNYGKAPAVIKKLQIAHFRGPHHCEGTPHGLEGKIFNMPNSDEFEQFVERHTQQLHDQFDRRIPGTNFIVPCGESNRVFYFYVNGNIQVNNQPFIDPIVYTESYLLGIIYYQILGQPSEIINFCYKGNMRDSFSLFNDYPPYNERRKIYSDKLE